MTESTFPKNFLWGGAAPLTNSKVATMKAAKASQSPTS